MTTSRLKRALSRVLTLAGKEALHISRDPRTLYLALVMPVFLLLLFGYGVSFDLDQLPVLVVDQDDTSMSRRFLQHLGASGELEIVGRLETAEAATTWFERDAARGAFVVPHGFEASLARGEATSVQFLVNAADGNTATQLLAKADAITARAGADLLAPPGDPPRPPIDVRVLTLFNPGAKSAYYLVPGLSAYVVAIVAVLLTALTVAREWEQGSMEQLFATPVARLEIVLGKLLPYLVLGSTAVLLVLAAGGWVFDVPFRGDPITLALAALFFLVGMLGQGLLISVLTRNQLVATQAAAMSSMLPSLILSGFVFPIENMPLVLRLLTYAIPARYFIEVLRGVLLRGNGLAVLWPEVLMLLLFASVMVTLSTARFKRRLG